MKAGKPRPKVFLAYGVSGSHNRFKEQMKALRQSLRSSGFLMIEADPAVGNPYQAACAAVHAADAIVVVCDYHSNGNGMVIERASWMRKPIVLVRDIDLGSDTEDVSGMMLGFAETHNLDIHGYKTNDDVVRLVKKQLLRKKFEQTPPVTLSEFLKPADDGESRSP